MSGKLWINFVDDLNVAFDPDVHCTESGGAMSFSMEEAEGAIGNAVSIVRKQTGWQILGEGQPTAILVVESPTGLPADAFVRARARIGEVPSDLFGARQELGGICAPDDIRDKILVWAKAGATTPEVDLLFSDADPEDIETYLLGRPGTYYVDPATHEISFNPYLDGDRVVDLEDAVFWQNKPPTDSAPEEGGPVRRLTAKLAFGWTQSAKGTCDIGWRLPYHMATLNPDFHTHMGRDLPSGLIDFGRGAGWTMRADKSSLQMTVGATGEFYSGREVYKHYQLSRTEGGSLIERPELLDWKHYQMIRLAKFTFDFRQVWVDYDYSQEREEEAFFEMTVPVQSTAVTADTADTLEFSLNDLFEDVSAPAWEENTEYLQGDRRTMGGVVYEAVRDVPAQPFFTLYPNAPVRGFNSYYESRHPYWKRAISNAALRSTTAASFLDSDRGRQVLEHVLCRLRKEAHRRMRGRNVTMTMRWEDARDLTIRDELRILVPFGLGKAPVVGKVINLKWNWPAKGQPTVEATISVPFGDGSDETADAGIGDYVADGYFEDEYVEEGNGVFGTAGDVAWTCDADPLSRPIDAAYLSNANYAVEDVELENDADVQFSWATSYAFRGKDPRDAPRDHPTRLRVKMRDLVAEASLVREYDIQAELLRGKRGVDLSTGGEP